MKTHTIEWNTIDKRNRATRFNPAGSLNKVSWLAANTFLAIVPALAALVFATWLITVPNLVIYLQATLWASGFLFLGLAIDSPRPFNGLSLLTGIALPVLAFLSSQVAVEIAIIPAAIVALWIAGAIWRR